MELLQGCSTLRSTHSSDSGLLRRSPWITESWIWKPPPLEPRMVRQEGCRIGRHEAARPGGGSWIRAERSHSRQGCRPRVQQPDGDCLAYYLVNLPKRYSRSSTQNRLITQSGRENPPPSFCTLSSRNGSYRLACLRAHTPPMRNLLIVVPRNLLEQRKLSAAADLADSEDTPETHLSG
jgi:hypothetical protein